MEKRAKEKIIIRPLSKPTIRPTYIRECGIPFFGGLFAIILIITIVLLLLGIDC